MRRQMTEEISNHPSARDRAAKVLTACYDGNLFTHDLLAEMQASDPLSPQDAALAAELVLGVLRHRLTAEHLAARFHRGRWASLRPSIRTILALAVYQLCWLDRIPDHAAVDQAVRQAKRHGRGVAAMVNAILRKLAECRGEIIDRPENPDPRRYLSIDDRRGRWFSENVFPDPTRRPLDYLVAATSHPSYLVERWHRRFKPALCRTICEAGQRRPPLVLRPNTLRITPADLLDRLRAAGHEVSVLDGTDALILCNAPHVSDLAEFAAGLCQPQDSTTQIPLRLSPPQPGELVVDLCAGVGTKSTQAAELMRNQGLVIASDTDAGKLDGIPLTAQRLGLSIIQPTPADLLETILAGSSRQPDVILLDVPCTNTGVLARRPEARYRASNRDLLALVEIQRDLLRRAQALSAPDTRIIYATCSLEREENEDQAAWFGETFPSWRIQTQVFTTPDADRDGGFAAVLTHSPDPSRLL